MAVAVKQLNVYSGVYTELFTQAASVTSPPLANINAADISPIDQRIYALATIGEVGQDDFEDYYIGKLG